MEIIYLFFLTFVWHSINTDTNGKFEALFLNIQNMCPNVKSHQKIDFFYGNSNIKQGFIFCFFGVYTGALFRHKYNGLIRIDFESEL